MIPLKSEEDLKMLQVSASILSNILKRLKDEVRPGVRTLELDSLAYKLIMQEDARPAFKGYQGYPATLCVSINEEIVHGIPGERVINSGDLVSIDLGVNYQGYFSDAAISLAVGEAKPEVLMLINASRMALEEGIKQARVGKRLSDISHRIQEVAEKSGFSVVRQFVGHGIGLNLHEEPEIPNFGEANLGPVLKEGMVLAIEPMVNMGGWESEILANGWTAVTMDRMPSAHFEHTVAITRQGPLVLTN